MNERAAGERYPLADGLALRRGTPQDAEAVAALNADLLRDEHETEPSPLRRDWTLDLFEGHPTCTPSLFTVVEDERTGAIVSSLCLIPQTWLFDGIPFTVGQIELVTPLPQYRKRGLVRRQFAEAHRWSEQLGHSLQIIDGIPFFYRQFGYEPAIEHGDFRYVAASEVPALPPGEAEPCRIREATLDDLPLIVRLYGRQASRYLLHVERDERIWRWELTGRRSQSLVRRRSSIIEDHAGKPLGYFSYLNYLYQRTLPMAMLSQFELKPGVNWQPIVPAVLRHLAQVAPSLPPGAGDSLWLALWLSSQHPAYQTLPPTVQTWPGHFALYARLANLPAFLLKVAPVLEARLAASALAGYTGELSLSFYRDGVRLGFQSGKLQSAIAWQPDTERRGDVAFPALTFLQLLFGFRTLAELQYAFPDCEVNRPEARSLVETLFPYRPSNSWILG